MDEWTEAQRYFAFYVIAGVESRWQYDSCNLGDAITIGIVQWYAYNAADLLTEIESDALQAFELLSDRVKSAVRDHPSSETYFWESFYLTNDDAERWKQCAALDQVKPIQERKFFRDATERVNTLASWGVDTSRVKETIMLLSAHWQNPSGCGTVVGNIGGSRTLEEYYNAILNTYPFPPYYNRYTDVLNYLTEWDGVSAPPDFGQIGGESIPTQPDGDNQLQSSVAYITAANSQDLIIYGEMGTGGRLLCHYTGNGVWLPVRNATAPEYPSTGGSIIEIPGGGVFAKIKALCFQYEKQFSYGWGAGRLDPVSSGYTDCSAFVWWVYNIATDGASAWLGTTTQTMMVTAKHIKDGDGATISLDGLIAGDLLIMGTGEGAAQQHVAILFDDGSAWGAGDAPCPRKEVEDASTGFASWGYNWIKAYRVVEDG